MRGKWERSIFCHLLRKVVRHLHVDEVRRQHVLARPTLFDDLNEFFGDVQAPVVIPAAFEPTGQLLRGVMVEHVHIQFALLR